MRGQRSQKAKIGPWSASLLRDEAELANAEISEKLSAVGTGIGSLAIGGAVLLAGFKKLQTGNLKTSRSVRALQRDAEINRVRALLDSTLGEQEHRLTPRELIRDGVVTLSGYGAGRLVLRPGDLIRRYPVPAAIAFASVIRIIFVARQRFVSRDS